MSDTKACLACEKTFTIKSGNASKYCSRPCQYTTRRGYVDFSSAALKKAVESSSTWTEVCENVASGARTGTLHKKVRSMCEEFEIDTSHLLYPNGRKKPAEQWKRRSLEEMLSSKKTRSGDLRVRLIKDGIKAAACERCSIKTWNDAPAPLELHHVDGDHSNNSLDNLQILCCNCHAQTDSWRKPFVYRKKNADQ